MAEDAAEERVTEAMKTDWRRTAVLLLCLIPVLFSCLQPLNSDRMQLGEGASIAEIRAQYRDDMAYNTTTLHLMLSVVLLTGLIQIAVVVWPRRNERNGEAQGDAA